MELSVPTSITGVAIAVPLQLDRKSDGNFIFFIEMGRVYIMLMFSYALTLFLLLSLWEVALDGVGSKDYECAHGKLKVQFACLFLYEASIFGALLKDVDLFRLIHNAEDNSSSFHLMGGGATHGAVLVEEKKGHMSNALKKFRPAPPPDMPDWEFTGMNNWYRAWCFLIICVPKFLFTVLLGFLGGCFILGCDSIVDIVLNSMAVNFVLEIDTVLYECFIAGGTKSAIEHMKPVEIEQTGTQRFIHWLTSTVFYPVVALLATLYLLFVEAGCGLHHVSEDHAHALQSLKIPLVEYSFLKGAE